MATWTSKNYHKNDKIYRGSYNYYRNENLYAEENFDVYRDRKEQTYHYISECTVRVSTGETLNLHVEYIKNKEFQEALKVAEILLNDEHDLIQKAVGWMLREVGKRDQKVLILFLKTNYKTMPRTSLRYAIEHFPETTRKKYLLGTI